MEIKLDVLELMLTYLEADECVNVLKALVRKFKTDIEPSLSEHEQNFYNLLEDEALRRRETYLAKVSRLKQNKSKSDQIT